MPVYPYRCPECLAEFDRFEPAAGSHELAPCACGEMAARVWTVPQAIVDNTEAYYNNGLGQVIKSKADIRDAQRRYHDQTGSNLVELGTETKWRAKRSRQEYARASELVA